MQRSIKFSNDNALIKIPPEFVFFYFWILLKIISSKRTCTQLRKWDILLNYGFGNLALLQNCCCDYAHFEVITLRNCISWFTVCIWDTWPSLLVSIYVVHICALSAQTLIVLISSLSKQCCLLLRVESLTSAAIRCSDF